MHVSTASSSLEILCLVLISNSILSWKIKVFIKFLNKKSTELSKINNMKINNMKINKNEINLQNLNYYVIKVITLLTPS